MLPSCWYEGYTQDEVDCYLCIEKESHSCPLESHSDGDFLRRIASLIGSLKHIVWDSGNGSQWICKKMFLYFYVNLLTELYTGCYCTLLLLNCRETFTCKCACRPYKRQSAACIHSPFTIYRALPLSLFLLLSICIIDWGSHFVCKAGGWSI